MKQIDGAVRGRAAAGQDPGKREQILDGARRCFLRLGFEGSSMNEITAEAGVSKGTIYVYFESKEELFIELIKRERAALLDSAEGLLHGSHSLAEALSRFGMAIAAKMSSDDVVRAQRLVLAVAERMPDVAESFFGPEPFSGVTMLKRYLEEQVGAGRLRIEDTDLAARQFIDLCTAATFKPRLFGHLKSEMPPEQLRVVVDSAVAMFLKFYGTGP